MKITSSRKEDILRRKAEYEADFRRRKAQYESEEETFREAQYAVADPVQQELESLFAKYPTLHARVQVDPWGRFGSRRGMAVSITVNDMEKFSDDTALAWNYSAYIGEDGEPVRETSSWSGMKAVTESQLKNLDETLAVLKELSTLDWSALLDRAMPAREDYFTVKNPEWEAKPDFKRELREAELEDIIGERKLIEVKAFPSSWYYPSYQTRVIPNVFVAIIKDSGTQYTIKEVSKYTMDRGMDEVKERFDNEATHRVKKSQIVPVDPINIIDVPE